MMPFRNLLEDMVGKAEQAGRTSLGKCACKKCMKIWDLSVEDAKRALAADLWPECCGQQAVLVG